MKHAERGELEKHSRVQQGCSFTGLIYPEWCLTSLKAHILPLHLNLSWIFRSTRRLRISQVPPSGWGWRGEKNAGWSGEKRKNVGLSNHMLVSLLLFAGAESPRFTLLNNTPPPLHPALPAQSRAQEAYSVRHRQGVRRSCHWKHELHE